MSYSLALIYESGKRYIIPVDILQKTLKISDEDMKKLEVAILKEIQKQ